MLRLPRHAPACGSRTPARGRTPLALALAALALLTSCGVLPRAWSPRPMVLETRHHPGNALAGPAAQDAPLAEADASLAVEVELLALSEAQPEDLGTLSHDAVLVAALGADRPLRAAAWQARGARTGSAEDARLFMQGVAAGDHGEAKILGSSRGALPPGVTMIARVREPIAPQDAGAEQRPWLGIALAREVDGSLTVALVTQGSAPPEPQLETDDPDAEPAPPEADETEEAELVLLSGHALDAPGELVVLLPVDADAMAVSGRGPAFALHLTTSAPPAADDPRFVPHRLAHARCLAECRALTGAGPDPTRPPLPPALLHGLQGLRRGNLRDASLRYLAEACAAPITADAILVADPALSDELAERVLARRGEPRDAAGLGLVLEQETLAALGARALEGALARSLESVLVRHVGELARHPGVLVDLAGKSVSLTGLRRRCINENLVFLEDNEPSARVRAFDWLVVQGAAPAGFAPLDERGARRQALAAAREAEAEAEAARAAEAPAPATETGP